MPNNTHFLEEFGEVLKKDCLQDEPPFCRVSCPFYLDVTDLIGKWRQGRFNAAYRSYQTAVGFPAIVSRICPARCTEHCVMKDRGGQLRLKEMEAASCRLAKRTAPNSYNLPPKKKSVAVIGGGLAGLGCALFLCNKKYSVTIFEASDRVGGSARGLMDETDFDAELQNQFQFEQPDIRTGVKLNAFPEGEWDAVFLATGRGGDHFGVNPSDSGAFASDRKGVFLGGETAGASDPVEALAQGIAAASAVERYLKTGLMNEPVPDRKTRLVIDPRHVEEKPAAPKETGEPWTGEDVRKEAERCLECSCNICMRECDLMRIQEKTPGRLYEESYITVRPSTLANDGRWATRRIASCDQCGLCKTVCPEHIDMGEFLMNSHHGLKDSDAMPWAFHDFFLRDMKFSGNEAALVLRNPAAGAEHPAADAEHSATAVEHGPYVLFPGCQFGASAPDLVADMTEWLFEKQPDSAVWLDCCGAPAVWAAEDEMQAEHVASLRRTWEELGRPTVLFTCPSCRKMFGRFLPEIPGLFMEEALLAWGIPERHASVPGVKFAVFDPCASRYFPQMQQAVRALADRLEITHRDLSHTGDFARCCSYGGQYRIAAPDYARRVRMERAEESPLPYLTSCMNCRDTFASRGKENIHILELAFGRTDRRRETPTVSARRENRLKLKADLELRWLGKQPEKREKAVKMICDQALEKKLSERHILLSEMEQVIEHCEREKCGAVSPDDGMVTGHLKIGRMTYWAQYLPLPDGSFHLLAGYAHRMNLEGE